MRAALTAITVLLLLSGCAGFEPEFKKPGATRLSGEEVSALLKGRTIGLINARGRSYTNSFEQDGTIRISGSKGSQYGRWRVDGDRYCLTLDEDPREQCMDIYRIDGTSYQMVNADGSLRNTFELQ